MRSTRVAMITLGILVCGLASGAPGLAGGMEVVETEEVVTVGGGSSYVAPVEVHSGRARTVEVYHSAGEEFGMGIASTFLSVLYTPVRLAYGVVGAGVGGAQGLLTGGNRRAADGTWRVTVEGDYYVRPDHLDGSEHFDFTNVEPVVHERYTTTDSDL